MKTFKMKHKSEKKMKTTTKKALGGGERTKKIIELLIAEHFSTMMTI